MGWVGMGWEQNGRFYTRSRQTRQVKVHFRGSNHIISRHVFQAHFLFLIPCLFESYEMKDTDI